MSIPPLSVELVAELGLAILLGGAIGLERELRDKPAGLRTHILICLGAALFANMASRLAAGGGDPGRMAGHIVAGVGFIGAGTILHHGNTVTGLTTAANIWVVAAIGITLGFGHYLDASAATVLVVGVLTILGRLEKVLERRLARHEIHVTLEDGVERSSDAVTPVQEALRAAGLEPTLKGVRLESGLRTLAIETGAGLDDQALLLTVLALPGVRAARMA